MRFRWISMDRGERFKTQWRTWIFWRIFRLHEKGGLRNPSPMAKLDLPDPIPKHQYSCSTLFFRSFAILQELLWLLITIDTFLRTLGLNSRQPNRARTSGIRSFMKFLLFFSRYCLSLGSFYTNYKKRQQGWWYYVENLTLLYINMNETSTEEDLSCRQLSPKFVAQCMETSYCYHRSRVGFW